MAADGTSTVSVADAAAPPRRGFGWLSSLERWLAGRQIAWLNGLPFLTHRLWRGVFSHHWARIDLSLRAMEAEIAIKALERQGWQHVATAVSAGEAGDPPLTTLVFAVLVPSGTGGGVGPIARELTVALADARVRDLHHYVVDPAPPRYETLPEWRAIFTPTGAGNTEPGPAGDRRRRMVDRAGAVRQRSAMKVRLFSAPGAISTQARLQEATGHPMSGVESVGTLTERLHRNVVALRKAVDTKPERVALYAAGAVTLLVSVVVTQVAATRASQAAGEELYLWWHVPRLGLLLLAAAALCIMAIGVTRVTTDRFGRTPQVLAVLAGVMTLGIAVGGYARQHVSLGMLLGVLAFALIGVLWKLAGRVRWRLLTIVLRVSSVAALLTVAAGYGRARLVLYHAGMGLHASEVDMPGTDALTFAAEPLLTAALPVAILLFVAWTASGWWLRFAGVVVTIMALATGTALLLSGLEQDRSRGRLVGVGLARPTQGGLRLDPGPTAKCLTSLAPEHSGMLTGPLPLKVWVIGAFGQQTLLLDPVKARASHEDRPADPEALKTFVPPRNVTAPIWYVPSGHMSLQAAKVDAPC